jgi:hypothetical protein
MAEAAEVDHSAPRAFALAAAVGLAVGLASVGIVVSIIAIPFFALARFAEPGNGLNEPLVRTGLVKVAIPAGLVLGAITGAYVGRWYRRGGRLPTE